MLEREPSIYHLPRAVSLDGEGMRLFQTMGLADETAAATQHQPQHPPRQRRGQAAAVDRPRGVGPEGWNNAYRFYQPELETILRDGFARYSSVDVRLRADAFALDERDDQRARALRKPRVGRRSSAVFARATWSAAMARARRCGASWVQRYRTCARTNAGSCSIWSSTSRPAVCRKRPTRTACRRRDSVLRSGAADDLHSDAGQAASLGIHADAAG